MFSQVLFIFLNDTVSVVCLQSFLGTMGQIELIAQQHLLSAL